jgi:tetratricopeptide (TPR) repeat protein
MALTTLLLAGKAGASAEVAGDLVMEALDIERLAARLAPASTQAAQALTPVYIGSQVTDLQVLEVTFQIDAVKPVRYAYSPAESIALNENGLHALTRIELAPGSHRLYVDYAARGSDDRPGVPRLRSRLVQTIAAPAAGQPLVIVVKPGGLGGDPSLELVGAAGDVTLRQIDYLIHSGRYFNAASQIMQMRDAASGSLPADYEQRLQTCIAGLRHAMPADASASPVLAQYQSAAASLDAGRNADAIPMLERIGSEKANSAESWVLRDQANTTLGYYFLSMKQPDLAATTFKRVRSASPYANTALLGLGWAMLAPRGNAAESTAPLTAQSVKTTLSAPEKLSTARKAMPFNNAWGIATGKRADDLRRALVPWTELVGRDPTDAAVQEAMLALPYAFEHLGAHEQARDYGRRAVEQLENTRGHLEKALEHIASGEMASKIVESDSPDGSGWSWWLKDLPPPRWWLKNRPHAPANFYFERLTEDEEFREHLEAAHQLHELGLAMSRRESVVKKSGDGALQQRMDALEDRLIAAEGAERAVLERAATRYITGIKEQTERYLVEAHFAIARLNDRPLQVSAR